MPKTEEHLEDWIKKSRPKPLVRLVKKKDANAKKKTPAVEEHLRISSANYLVGLHMMKLIKQLDGDEGEHTHFSFVRLESFVKFLHEKGREAYRIIASNFQLVLTGLDEGLFKEDYLKGVVNETKTEFPRPYWEFYAESLAVLGSVHGVRLHPSPSLDCVFRDGRFVWNSMPKDLTLAWSVIRFQDLVVYEEPEREENGVQHFAPIEMPDDYTPPRQLKGPLTESITWRQIFGGLINSIVVRAYNGHCQQNKIATRNFMMKNGPCYQVL